MQSIERLNLKQKLFITHTYIYYELDDNIISDYEYDRMALSLEEARDTLFEWKHTTYRDIFRGWTSATGISLVKECFQDDYEFFMRLAKSTLEAHQDYLDTL